MTYDIHCKAKKPESTETDLIANGLDLPADRADAVTNRGDLPLHLALGVLLPGVHVVHQRVVTGPETGGESGRRAS